MVEKFRMIVKKIVPILVCSFIVSFSINFIQQTYGWFTVSKKGIVRANVSSENDLFNVDIVYKKLEKVNGMDKWVAHSTRVIGSSITYNPDNDSIINPIQIVISPINNNKPNVPQMVYFEVQENLQEYMVHINPIKFNGEIAKTYIDINARSAQSDVARNLVKAGIEYTTGYLRIKYLNGIIDKSIKVQFQNNEIALRYSSPATSHWYDVAK